MYKLSLDPPIKIRKLNQFESKSEFLDTITHYMKNSSFSSAQALCHFLTFKPENHKPNTQRWNKCVVPKLLKQKQKYDLHLDIGYYQSDQITVAFEAPGRYEDIKQ